MTGGTERESNQNENEVRKQRSDYGTDKALDRIPATQMASHMQHNHHSKKTNYYTTITYRDSAEKCAS